MNIPSAFEAGYERARVLNPETARRHVEMTVVGDPVADAGAHAQVRRLIRESGTWDESVYGTPLCAAHTAVSSANFSAAMRYQAQRLGPDLDADARAGFMLIWRYASRLVGAPEELLFEGDEEKTREPYRVARVCEPPPGHEAAVIANALVEALPVVAGRTGSAARKAMTTHAYRVAWALLGDELADQLQFPHMQTTGLLAWMHGKRRARRAIARLAPGIGRKRRGETFAYLLEASMLDDLSYRIPDHLQAEKATPW